MKCFTTTIIKKRRNDPDKRFRVESELTSIKNKLARWFSVYFPEYSEVYDNLEAKSGLAVIKVASMPEDIVKLGVEGIIQIWRAARLRGLTRSRAEKFVAAAKGSIGMKHGAAAAKLELNVLIEDFENILSPIKKR